MRPAAHRGWHRGLSLLTIALGRGFALGWAPLPSINKRLLACVPDLLELDTAGPCGAAGGGPVGGQEPLDGCWP